MSDKLQFVDSRNPEGPNLKPYDKLKFVGQ